MSCHLEAVLGPFASLGVSFLDNQDRFSLACSNLLKHNHCNYSSTGCKSYGVVILQLLHLLECVHALGEDVIPHDAHDYWHLEICKCISKWKTLRFKQKVAGGRRNNWLIHMEILYNRMYIRKVNSFMAKIWLQYFLSSGGTEVQ